MVRDVFICSCNSMEHQMYLWYDEEEKILYTEVHLITWHNFFRRFWYGIRYAFGHKSRFGAWDEFLFEIEDAKKLQQFLNSNLI
jgi:hypothetical protein